MACDLPLVADWRSRIERANPRPKPLSQQQEWTNPRTNPRQHPRGREPSLPGPRTVAKSTKVEQLCQQVTRSRAPRRAGRSRAAPRPGLQAGAPLQPGIQSDRRPELPCLAQGRQTRHPWHHLLVGPPRPPAPQQRRWLGDRRPYPELPRNRFRLRNRQRRKPRRSPARVLESASCDSSSGDLGELKLRASSCATVPGGCEKTRPASAH